MGSMWDKTVEMVENYSSGGKWLRLKDDGETFKGMFAGEPFPREVAYTGSRYVAWDPAVHQGKPGVKRSLRVGFNVISADGTCQIFEFSVQSFKTLIEVQKKYGFNRLYEVTRKGKKDDTKTTYTILPEDPLPAEELARLQAVELFDIEAEYLANDAEDHEPSEEYEKKKPTETKPKTKPAAEKPAPAETKPAAAPANGTNGAHAPTPPVSGAETIETKVAQNISTVLKELPQDKMKPGLDRFLKAFDVKRIKDVPKAREADAIALVQAIATEAGVGTPAPAAEVDPFA